MKILEKLGLIKKENTIERIAIPKLILHDTVSEYKPVAPQQKQEQVKKDSFQDVLDTVRATNLNTKVYKSMSKIPKTKGSTVNILYKNSKEMRTILKQCKDKYEMCNVFEQMNVISLVNRK